MVYIEQAAILSSLGTLTQTVDRLFSGNSSVIAGPYLGFDASHACFADPSNCNIHTALATLKKSISFEHINPQRTILLFCAAKGDIRIFDALCDGSEFKTSSDTVSPLLNEQAQLARQILFSEVAQTMALSNACASGSIGIELAYEFLSTGQFDNAIVVGFDALSRFVVSGFMSLNAVSPLPARPFDAARNGLSLGEGAAVALLSTNPATRPVARICGAASSNDANHRTGPSRTGDGLFRAAAAAIDNAGILPEHVAGVKCHGTATLYNDAMEAKALTSLFGVDSIPPCVSLKGALGHTSGGGSLLEILIGAKCLAMHTLPPTAGFSVLGTEERIPISSQPQSIGSGPILCLAAGFGGINSAVVIGEVENG